MNLRHEARGEREKAMATLVIRERQQAEAERAQAIQAALTSRAAEAASSA